MAQYLRSHKRSEQQKHRQAPRSRVDIAARSHSITEEAP